MDIWLKLTNTVTVGNIMAVVTLICCGIYGYYKIRRYLAQQHAAFVAYVATLTENQTVRLEQCIHRTPGHPENPQPVTNDIQETTQGSSQTLS